MAAATITTRIENSDTTTEVVVLTATDAETYTSRKFGSIDAAQVTANSDVDAHLNVTFSGAVATINWAGQTDKVCTLTLWGRK
ncbi:MAG: hypothetical protein ACTSU7_00215 [Candidatus Heimdallarchaeaceae archaeon]